MTPLGVREGLVRSRKRRTVGLLIDWVALPFHSAVMNAVHDYCADHDTNLITFVTGQLGSDRVTERCRNLLAELATSDVIDGLLVSASTLESFAGHAHLDALLRSYGDLPLVTLHDRFDQIPAVTADNSAGTTLLLEHLVDVHGYRRFAFVAGKVGRHDFDERRACWKDFLASRGLAYREDLVFQGDYGPESGAAAVRAFLPHRAEFDVLVLANDAMVVGARQELARQRVEAFPMVGFDDSDQATHLAVTTVRQSLYNQVALAAGLLEDQLAGRPTAPMTRETPALVVRTSCGCAPAASPVVDHGTRSGIDYASPLSDRDLDGLYDLGEAMFSTLDQAEEIRRAVYQFRDFGADACCISLYEHRDDPLSTSRLTVAYDGERDFELDPEGLQFPTRALVPPGILDRGRRRSLMVQALFCGSEQIGFAVFSVVTRKWRLYEMLRRELSLALKGSRLVRAALSHTDELERRVMARTEELEATNRQLQTQYEEKAQIEAELSRREERYRDLIMKTPALVLELDAQFRPLFLNQSGLEMLGLERLEERRGLSFLRSVHPDDVEAVEAALVALFEGGPPASGEFRLVGPTGRTSNLVYEANALVKGQVVRAVRLSGINVTSLFANVTRPEEVLFEHYRFSPRVREVLELMLRGIATRDMATRLGISENTVKTHIRSIYQEVGVTSRSGLFKILREYQVHHFGHQSYVFSMLSTLVQD